MPKTKTYPEPPPISMRRAPKSWERYREPFWFLPQQKEKPRGYKLSTASRGFVDDDLFESENYNYKEEEIPLKEEQLFEIETPIKHAYSREDIHLWVNTETGKVHNVPKGSNHYKFLNDNPELFLTSDQMEEFNKYGVVDRYPESRSGLDKSIRKRWALISCFGNYIGIESPNGNNALHAIQKAMMNAGIIEGNVAVAVEGENHMDGINVQNFLSADKWSDVGRMSLSDDGEDSEDLFSQLGSKIYFISGLRGCGKTSLLRKLKEKRPSLFVLDLDDLGTEPKKRGLLIKRFLGSLGGCPAAIGGTLKSEGEWLNVPEGVKKYLLDTPPERCARWRLKRDGDPGNLEEAILHRQELLDRGFEPCPLWQLERKILDDLENPDITIIFPFSEENSSNQKE